MTQGISSFNLPFIPPQGHFLQNLSRFSPEDFSTTLFS